jgi:hypothetical protein
MKQHITAAAIAAAVAGAIGLSQPAKVTQAIHASKHAWPDLTDAQKAALSSALGPLGGRIKIDIVCNDAACSDLAQDIDDACEAAGVDSVLDRAIGPLGYGIGLQAGQAEKTAAESVAAALKAVGIDAPIVPGKSAPGYVAIVIGKHRK